MRIAQLVKRSVVLMVTVALAGVTASAWTQGRSQAPTGAPTAKAEQTPSEFYMSYLEAFKKAKTIEDVLKYKDKQSIKEFNEGPPEMRKGALEMIRMMQPTNIKIVKEQKTATGAILTLEGVNPDDKKKATGTVVIIKEGGVWKTGQESWKM